MKWIISNHKENIVKEKDLYRKGLQELSKKVHLVICPKEEEIPFYQEEFYQLGSQDVLDRDKYQEYHIEYTIVGHKDQRIKDSNMIINHKIKQLLKENITPILCIGEDLIENQVEVLEKELEECLDDIKGEVWIAYEPNWAIGSNRTPEKESLQSIINWVKIKVENKLGYSPRILYGGSVNIETIPKLEQLEGIDGYLIGRASLEIENLRKIIEVITW